MPATAPPSTSHWYQNTIIYELHVRSFADGNGDGIGDFKGLIEKLDYLERLGVGVIWLLPFYPSPLRDDGYDVADYMDIHPDYGTLADFRHFLREAHDRGLRVITELVLNHSSDQHPWFQRACAAPPGSAHRDFYVWSDTPDTYQEARIIFEDSERSNWAWHPQARAYYWHRFYAHQPDLNFDNPQVRRAMLKVVDFWLGLGVDALRLDAVPYLIERPGTTCENLPETHACLKELRSHIDERFPGRMLLAEANLWPEEAVSYFGQGDECHMAFHFPLMPRIFMSMWLEDRHPIIDIMEQTPAIPDNCQWALFLRNHDELTLEKISDEERDYMFHAYARNTQARLNLGIRRRLAPLMQKNRRKMELINVLLFSFPGTPCLYYGDEIGMGDNYYLGDRNGVRTPMQWTGERNAGFSAANPQALYLPLIIDPEYHYEAVNVETEERSPSSFLWWMRRLIAVYKAQQPVLGRGSIRFVHSENTRVLSFLREHGESRLLVAANLSRFAQVVELNLAEFAGHTPFEVQGETRFPVIGKTPYVLTLGPYDYFWFRLRDESAATLEGTAAEIVLEYTEEAGIFLRDNQSRLERTVLPSLADQALRNFPRIGRPRELSVVDVLPASGGNLDAALILAEDAYSPALQNTWLLMTAALAERREEAAGEQGAERTLARLKGKGGQKILTDGFQQPRAVDLFTAVLGSSRKRQGRSGAFHVHTHAPKLMRELLAGHTGPTRRVRETAHTCAHALGNLAYLKFYRRPTEGINPEVEILEHLAKVKFPGVPRLLASLSYQPIHGEPLTLAVGMEYIQGAVDGETFILDTLSRFFEDILACGLEAPDFVPLTPLAAPSLPETRQTQMAEAYGADFFRQFGRRCMQLHKVLAGLDTPSMVPEPFSAFYLRSLYQTARNQTHRVDQGLEKYRRSRTDGGRPPLKGFPAKRILERFTRLRNIEITGQRIRIHGDFRLANVLHLGKDFLLVNFDGDAWLPVKERSVKRSPLRDVAAMLFSIGLVAEKAFRAHIERTPADRDDLAPWLSLWRYTACNAFLDGYREESTGAAFLPRNDEEFMHFLELCLLKRIERKLERALEESPENLPMLLDITHSLLRIFP